MGGVIAKRMRLQYFSKPITIVFCVNFCLFCIYMLPVEFAGDGNYILPIIGLISLLFSSVVCLTIFTFYFFKQTLSIPALACFYILFALLLRFGLIYGHKPHFWNDVIFHFNRTFFDEKLQTSQCVNSQGTCFKTLYSRDDNTCRLMIVFDRLGEIVRASEERSSAWNEIAKNEHFVDYGEKFSIFKIDTNTYSLIDCVGV